MRRVRVEQKAKKDRDERSAVLPLDPRDQDVIRAKRVGDLTSREKRT